MAITRDEPIHSRVSSGGFLARVRAVFVGTGLFLLLAAGFTYVTLATQGSRYFDQPLNSDLIEPFLFVGDILRDPGSLLRWSYPNSLFLVPDWLITAILIELPISRQFLPVIYSGTLLAGYMMTSAPIAAASGVTRIWAFVLLSSTVLLALLWLTLTTPLGTGTGMTLDLGAPYIHTGAIVMGLCTIALLVNISASTPKGSPFSTRMLVLCCAMTALFGYSDLLYVVWMLVPAAVIAGAVLFIRSGPRSTAPVGGLLLAALLGVLVDHLTRSAPGAAGARFAASAGVWWETLRDDTAAGAWQFPAALGLSLLMLIRSALLIAGWRHRRELSASAIAELMLTACTWAAWAFPLVTGSFLDSGLLRYSMPVLILPYIWIALLIATYATGRLTNVLVACCLFCWIAAGFGLVPQVKTGAAYFEDPYPLGDCLLARGLTDGYGDYWNAKSLIWASDYKLHIAQLVGSPEAYTYNFDSAWFAKRADGTPFRPDFILPTRLSEFQLAAKFGLPGRIVSCAGQDIWLYPNRLALVR